MRDKLFFYNHTFSSRFLNEEIRNSEFYNDGSALRHVATVKELFATHVCLLWASIKMKHGLLKGTDLSEDEMSKVNYLIKNIKSLINNKHFLE